jgi:hypothetical protein
MTITKRGVSALLALLIPLVAFAPLAGSAGPILRLAQSFAVLSASTVTQYRPYEAQRRSRSQSGSEDLRRFRNCCQ